MFLYEIVYEKADELISNFKFVIFSLYRTEHLIIQVLKRHKQIGDLLLEAVEDSFLQIRHSRLEEMSSTWETFLQSLGEQSNFKPCINTLKEVSENTASLSTLLTDGLKDMNVSLGLAVHALGKSMLQQLQKESLKRISRALEEESWRFVDDLGVNAANLLELGHLLGIRIELPGTGQEPEMTSCSNIVVLQSVSFRLTHACLLTVAYFLDGLSLCEVVPSLAKDAAHQTLETMRMFNSKTCQLILGAGAMQVSENFKI